MHRDRRPPRGALQLLAAILLIIVFAAACGSGDDDAGDGGADSSGETDDAAAGDSETDDDGAGSDEQTDDDVDADGENDAGAPAEPVDVVMGGEITIGQFAPPRGFDPTIGGAANGAVGGLEMMMLYDTIVSWNPTTGAYENRTAAALTTNDDASVWTLVLKDGIVFSDGTPYDAEAVRFNIERHVAPSSLSQSRTVLRSVLDSMTVIDDLTVEFTLTRGWPGFPYVLSLDAGLIASPTAIDAAGDTFNSAPGDAGAGPFLLADHRPGEATVYERNPDYHGAPPPLDRITFVPTSGGQDAAYEALKAGQLDASFFRSARALADAEADGLTTHRARIAAGNIIDINAGIFVTCQGGAPAGCESAADGSVVQTDAPGRDPRVREAIAAAIDPDQVNQRAHDGLALAGSALFSDGFPLSPGIDGPTHDPERAAQLVAEAKADGWDGSLRLFSVNDDAGQALGLTVAAMLTAAGMDVEVDSSFEPLPLLLQVQINRDYDVVIWGSGIGENPDGNYALFLAGFSSAAQEQGFRGYASPEMDAAIEALGAAATPEAVTEAYAMLAEVWNDDVPAVALNELENGLITRPDLFGVDRTSASSFLFDEAWLGG